MKHYLMIFLLLICMENISAQLVATTGARINIQSPASLVLTGNVNNAGSYSGTGKLLMKGTATQQLNLSGNSVGNITIQNSNNIQLVSNAQINGYLNFVLGKIITGNFMLTLASTGLTAGGATGKFVETTGSGQFRKITTAALSNFVMPVGNGTNYTPVSLTASGTFSGAVLSVKAKPGVHPNKPAGVSNYLNTYWSIGRTGISGTVNAVATYTTANIVGNELLYKGFFWNGSSWTKTGLTNNTSTNQVNATITGSGGDVYAMSDFAGSASSINRDEGSDQLTLVSEKLYPNPTKGQSILTFNAQSSGSVHLTILDATGKLIMSKYVFLYKGNQQQLINLSAYRNGTYEVKLHSKTINKSYKLIKR